MPLPPVRGPARVAAGPAGGWVAATLDRLAAAEVVGVLPALVAPDEQAAAASNTTAMAVTASARRVRGASRTSMFIRAPPCSLHRPSGVAGRGA